MEKEITINLKGEDVKDLRARKEALEKVAALMNTRHLVLLADVAEKRPGLLDRAAQFLKIA